MTVVPLPPLQQPGKPMRSQTADAAVPPPISAGASDKLGLRTRVALGLLGIALAWGLFAVAMLGMAKLFG